MRVLIALLLLAASMQAQVTERPVVIETDFNCDGKKDLALSNGSEWGNAGGDWGIYIRQSDGRFRYAGSAFFHPLAFHIERAGDQTALMTVYQRAGGGDGSLVTYKITKNSVKQLSSERFRPSENKPDSPNHKRYEEMFSGLREHPLHRLYTSSEIVVDGQFATKK